MTHDEMKQLAAEAKGRAEKASKGPWEHTNINSVHGPNRLICDAADAETETEEERQDNDFRFIARARTDVPALSNAVLQLLAEVERLKNEMIRKNVAVLNLIGDQDDDDDDD